MSIIAYKGMDEHMQCRGFQYEVGREYVHDGEVKCCPSEDDVKRGAGGFHACEVPLDIFNYYDPATSRFFAVTQDGSLSRNGNDSKVASSKIKIDAEIGIPGLVKAHIEYIKEHLEADDEIEKAGDRSAATNTGDQSAATNTGYRSAATNTGDQSAATNTGYRSAASVSGEGSVAIVTGYQSKAKANLGSAIVIAERGEWDGKTYPLLSIKAAIIDGKVLKPDTWYTLKGGEFVEVEE